MSRTLHVWGTADADGHECDGCGNSLKELVPSFRVDEDDDGDLEATLVLTCRECKTGHEIPVR